MIGEKRLNKTNSNVLVELHRTSTLSRESNHSMSASIPTLDTKNVKPQHEQPIKSEESEVAQDGAPSGSEAAVVTEGDANLLLNLSNVPQKSSQIVLQENDILSGRGRGPNSHSGNVYYRELIKSEKLAYVNGNPREKKFIISKILNKIESMKPPGRFLKEGKNNNWELVCPDEARKKTAQALRENAVKIRKSLTPPTSTLPSLTSENRAKQQSQSTDQTIPERPPFDPKNPLAHVPPFDPKNPMANWDLPIRNRKVTSATVAVDQPNPASSTSENNVKEQEVGFDHVKYYNIPPFDPKNPMANWDPPGRGFPKLRKVTSAVTSAVNQPNSVSDPGTIASESASTNRVPDPAERKRRDPPGNHCDEIDINNWQKRRTKYYP